MKKTFKEGTMIYGEISRQGDIAVNLADDSRVGAYVINSGPGIALVEIDLHTKYAEVCMVSNGGHPSVMLGSNSRTINLASGEGYTEIGFPAMSSWDIRMAECSRYTLLICFTKDK